MMDKLSYERPVLEILKEIEGLEEKKSKLLQDLQSQWENRLIQAILPSLDQILPRIDVNYPLSLRFCEVRNKEGDFKEIDIFYDLSQGRKEDPPYRRVFIPPSVYTRYEVNGRPYPSGWPPKTPSGIIERSQAFSLDKVDLMIKGAGHTEYSGEIHKYGATVWFQPPRNNHEHIELLKKYSDASEGVRDLHLL